MPRTRQRVWLLRLLTFITSVLMVCVAFLLIEGILFARDFLGARGTTGTTFEGSVYEFCASRHHRLLPNGRFRHTSYEYDYIWANNSLGMRDRERPRQKPPDAFRILILGDSMIQGQGVTLEDAMVTRLEGLLNHPARTKPIEVLNGGVFGYSPMLEYLYLQEIVDPLQPDLVVVGFFLQNDVGEDNFYARKARSSPNGEAISFDDREWPWSSILEMLDRGPELQTLDMVGEFRGGHWWEGVKDVLRHSQVLRLVKSHVDGLAYPARREREFALVREHQDDIRYDLGLVNYPVRTREERLGYWAFSAKYLETMSALCRARGVPMVLLVIPPAERLDGTTEFDEPYEVLHELGRRLSVPVVNLLPDFVGKDPYSLYYKFDRHWTPEGNRLAAEVVARELRRVGVLPGEDRPE